jgi:hypothetical protein
VGELPVYSGILRASVLLQPVKLREYSENAKISTANKKESNENRKTS